MAKQKQVTAKSTKNEYYKYFGVLFLLAATATLMSTMISFHWVDWVRWFIGGLLLVFGSFKLITYDTFLVTFPRYDSLAERFKAYNYLFPILQVFLGICFILDYASGFRNVVSLLMAIEALYSVSGRLIRHGPSKRAVCLPGLLKLPLSTTLLFESLLLTITVSLIIVGSVFHL